MLSHFLNSSLREIRILSRDEKKQDDMRKKYGNDKIKFYIGDVRDYQSVINAVRVLILFSTLQHLNKFHHANFIAGQSDKYHRYRECSRNGNSIRVKRVVCLSTDKAVYPINAMGINKAMMEKVAVAKSKNCLGYSYNYNSLWKCYGITWLCNTFVSQTTTQ